jgi:hypothetical protein
VAAAQTSTDEWTNMASSGKRKTTMAKLSRESRLRERRMEKKARKELRKQASAEQAEDPGRLPGAEAEALDGADDDALAGTDDDHPAVESVARTLAGDRGA